MSESTIKVGVIGAGSIANAHIKALMSIDGVEVTAIWNRTKSNAESLLEKHGLGNAKVYDSWEKMIEEAQLDAIIIATAPQIRKGPVIAALKAGLHLLVEKPFATTIEDGIEMVAAASNSNCITAVNFCHRYDHKISAARRIVQAGQIGKLRDYSCRWPFHVSERLRPSVRPFVIESNGGLGTLGELASHQFDMFSFLTGQQIESISAILRWDEPDNPKLRTNMSYHILAKSKSDIGIAFEHTEPAVWSLGWSIYIEGEKGHIVIPDKREDYLTVGFLGDDEVKTFTPSENEPIARSTLGLVSDFIKAVRGSDRSSFLPTFSNGLNSLKVVTTALEADRKKQWISVNR